VNASNLRRREAYVTGLTECDGGTRMEIRSTYASREQLDQLVEMGMLEGL
jgi:hypothetical protein